MSVIPRTPNGEHVDFRDLSPMNSHRIRALDGDSRANLMTVESQRSNGFNAPSMFRADTLDDANILDTQKISPDNLTCNPILEVEDLDLSPTNLDTMKKIDLNLQVKMLDHFERVEDSGRLEMV